MSENTSPLKTRQRCCPDFHPHQERDGKCRVINCLCTGYTDKYGLTYIYCPECDQECPMGKSNLTHLSSCSLKDVLLRGTVSRLHAYRTEKECAASGIDYLTQPYFGEGSS